MGAALKTNSKPPAPVIPYDEAVQRLSHEEFLRYQEGFARLVESDGKPRIRKKANKSLALSRDAFFSSFLEELVPDLPRKLQEVTFRGFAQTSLSGDSEFCTFEEFICGVALIRHGTPEERLRFLFDALSDSAKKAPVDGRKKSTEIQAAATYEEIRGFVGALRYMHSDSPAAGQMQLEELKNRLVDEARRDILDEEERRWQSSCAFYVDDLTPYEVKQEAIRRSQAGFTFMELRRWASENLTKELVSWIFDLEHRLEVEEQREPPQPLEIGRQCSLATMLLEGPVAQTRPQAMASLVELRKAHAALRANSPSGVVDEAALRQALCPPVSTDMVRRMFESLDQKRNGQIDLREFVAGFSVLYSGSWEEKLQWLVSLFDHDEDGVMTWEEVSALVASLWRVEILYESHAMVGEDLGSGVQCQPSLIRGASGSLQPQSIRRNVSGSVVPMNRVDELTDEAMKFAAKRQGKPGERVGENTIHTSDLVLWLTEGDKNESVAKRFLARLDETTSQHLGLGVRPTEPAQERELVTEAFAAALTKKPELMFMPVNSAQASKRSRSTKRRGKQDQSQRVKLAANPARRGWQFDPARCEEGDVWCILDQRWWKTWCEYSGFDQLEVLSGPLNPPAGINNEHLVLSGSRQLQLKPNSALSEDVDYVLLPQQVFQLLQAWYGGGPTIERRVVCTFAAGKQGLNDDDKELELYPLLCLAFRSDKVSGEADLQSEQKLLLSAVDTLGDVKQKVAAVLSKGKTSDASRLWVYVPGAPRTFRARKSPKWVQVESELRMGLRDVVGDTALQLLEQDGGLRVLLEFPNSSGTWLRKGTSSDLDVEEYSSDVLETADSPGKPMRAAVGLHNLGNTCYLNSATQNLFAVRLLREYFTHKNFLYDVNEEPGGMGMRGKLACVFGLLMQEMDAAASGKQRAGGSLFLSFQSIGGRSCAPRQLKQTIGKFTPEFAGYRQQDAQEYLAVLLECLHQDLNRRRNTKYIEIADSEDRPDAVVATEWWQAHLARNMSVVTFLFDGQFKNCTTCQQCGHVSSRFEPFRFLPVPLPVNERKPLIYHLIVTVRFYATRRWPARVMIEISNRATIADVLHKVSELETQWGLEKQNLVCTVVQRKKVAQGEEARGGSYLWRWFPGYHHVSLLSYQDLENLVIYEVLAEEPALAAKSISNPESNPNPESSFTHHARDLDRLRGTLPEGIPAGHVLVQVLHREMAAVEAYFLKKVQPRLDPSLPPFVLCVPAELFGEELYFRVWDFVKRFFEEFEPMTVQRRRDPAAFSIRGARQDRWGYRLSFASTDGARCSKCSLMRGCSGCDIAAGRSLGDWMILSENETIAVDWEGSLLQSECFRASAALYVEEHNSLKTDEDGEHETKDSIPTLEECLSEFTVAEEVTAYCPKCTKKQSDYTETTQTKETGIWGAPPVLLVHLKRFQENRYGGFEKNERLIQYPIQGLDLAPFLVPDREGTSRTSKRPGSVSGQGSQTRLSRGGDSCSLLYDLVGVVQQSGSMNGGHYTASCFEERDGLWWNLNDSFASRIGDTKRLVTSSAYLLVYRRQDMLNADVSRIFPADPKLTVKVDVEAVAKRPWRRGHDEEEADAPPQDAPSGRRWVKRWVREALGLPPPQTALNGMKCCNGHLMLSKRKEEGGSAFSTKHTCDVCNVDIGPYGGYHKCSEGCDYHVCSKCFTAAVRA